MRQLESGAPIENAEQSPYRMASTSELSIHFVHYFRTEISLLSFSDIAMLSAYFLECLGCFSESY